MTGVRLRSIPAMDANSVIENGDGGNGPLHQTLVPGGRAVTYAIPKKTLKAMIRDPHALNVVILDDGSVSVAVVPVVLVAGTT